MKKLKDEVGKKLEGEVESIQQWLLDGIRLWVETFMASRLTFRIYPFAQHPSFQVICNLKRGCFVDSDLEHLLYGYGNRPNVRLAAFGLITSMPTDQVESFDPLAEFANAKELSTAAQFEKVFRNLFTAMEGMESMMRFSRYPSVTIHPIAVYRSFAVSCTT